MSELESDLNIDVSIASLFAHPSIAELVTSPQFTDAMESLV